MKRATIQSARNTIDMRLASSCLNMTNVWRNMTRAAGETCFIILISKVKFHSIAFENSARSSISSVSLILFGENSEYVFLCQTEMPSF